MAKILTFEIPENEYNDLKAFLQECSAEIRKSLEIMRQDQAEIDRLRKESQEIRARAEKLKAETRKVLDDLEREIMKAA
jgi:cell division protein FtsB